MPAAHNDLKALIRTIADYPKTGVQFRDITTLVADAWGFNTAIGRMAAMVADVPHTIIAGIESRGFVFGAALAVKLGKGFVLIRKRDKLPGTTLGVNYALEYGADRIEMHADAVGEKDSVLLVDDLIATGGTALAAVRLIRSARATVAGAAFLIDLPELGGSHALKQANVTATSLMRYSGH
jgi:adenine phosphoribosyltransferase